MPAHVFKYDTAIRRSNTVTRSAWSRALGIAQGTGTFCLQDPLRLLLELPKVPACVAAHAGTYPRCAGLMGHKFESVTEQEQLAAS